MKLYLIGWMPYTPDCSQQFHADYFSRDRKRVAAVVEGAREFEAIYAVPIYAKIPNRRNINGKNKRGKQASRKHT